MRSIMTMLAGLCLLVATACSPTNQAPTTDQPTEPTQNVTFSMSKFATTSRTVLTAIEMSVSTYEAGAPVAADVQAKITAAEKAADALVDSLPTAVPADFPAKAQAAMNAINNVMAALPAGTLKPRDVAGVQALELLVSAIVPLIAGEHAPEHPRMGLKLVR